MNSWMHRTLAGLTALAGLGALAGTAQGQDPYYTDAGYAEDGAYQDPAYFVADSLEARVWLDRGDEPVVEWGDEVRVYYRTSHDAYAAIFRIDTDGRISLLYPQHPDADPYVVGGRDYRLVFREGSRWKVREDPGVGYFFMVASQQPLDFSLFGFDADRGWDLRGVGETVYEDPYVAIDDYVAAVLPEWETTPYALDFLEYSVGEAHDYPRFLCYDCHAFQSYARWDPYARACSSYQVVIWDDPYFYPRFRYLGTRVVFARPIGPRPRYSVTARLVGSGPRPIVRSRPAPPRRTAVFKEAPRRGSAIMDRRGAGAGSVTGRTGPPSRVVAPQRGRPSAAIPGASPRRTPPDATRRGLPSATGRSTPSATGRATPPAAGRSAPSVRPDSRPSARRGVPPDARSRGTGASSRREPPLPSARRGVPPGASGGTGARVEPRERPTLQRRPPAAGRR
ncbi:MAG: DUF4384 domain-containing protein, partial [Longimicrobiales bacterium]|nr:DUF4384 domain-containing protein [Longimicrobiales bacterium]